MTQQVKRAFKYRFLPTDEQAAELSRASAEYTRPGFKRREGRLTPVKPAQRELSRKAKGPANREKARRRVAGAVREKVPLNVREWTCDCGTVHDRDVNTARNILAAGLAVTACGEGVRPQRESSRTGRSSVKQDASSAKVGIPHL